MFRQDGSCPALLEDLRSGFPYGAVTRYGPPFQTLPVPKTQATGLVRFRSPLLTESRLMSFPPATEMFQFAGFASRAYEFSSGYPCGWVAPFGDPGINDRSHLPRAFRSVPRPSSPLSAKASTRCPYFALERHTQRQGPSQMQPTQHSTSRHRRSRTTSMRQTLLLPEDTSSQDTPPPADTRPASHAHRPSAAPVSRYGHTTRFFTIVNQQHAPALRRTGRSEALRRVVVASRRSLATAVGAPSRRCQLRSAEWR